MGLKNPFKGITDEEYLKVSRIRLEKRLVTHMTAIFTNCLSSVQLAYAAEIADEPEKWKALRATILNQGNNEIRGVQSELDGFEVGFIPLTVEVPIKPRKES